MIFLKWYTFAMLTLSLLINLYSAGSEEEVNGFVFFLITTIPMLIYVFLS